MDAPSFIFDIFEKELENMQKALLAKVATKYNLNEEELVKTFIDHERLHLVPNNDVTVVVCKKINKDSKKPVDASCRCTARIWNRGKGGQCTRQVMVCDNSQSQSQSRPRYCAQHSDKRKHGDIGDKADAKLFPKNPTALYK